MQNNHLVVSRTAPLLQAFRTADEHVVAESSMRVKHMKVEEGSFYPPSHFQDRTAVPNVKPLGVDHCRYPHLGDRCAYSVDGFYAWFEMRIMTSVKATYNSGVGNQTVWERANFPGRPYNAPSCNGISKNRGSPCIPPNAVWFLLLKPP